MQMSYSDRVVVITNFPNWMPIVEEQIFAKKLILILLQIYSPPNTEQLRYLNGDVLMNLKVIEGL